MPSKLSTSFNVATTLCQYYYWPHLIGETRGKRRSWDLKHGLAGAKARALDHPDVVGPPERTAVAEDRRAIGQKGCSERGEVPSGWVEVAFVPRLEGQWNSTGVGTQQAF